MWHAAEKSLRFTHTAWLLFQSISGHSVASDQRGPDCAGKGICAGGGSASM